MTPEQIDKLEAGRELDALIAEKVCGVSLSAGCSRFRKGHCDGSQVIICGACGLYGHGNCYGNGSGQIRVLCEFTCDAPSYSSDIAAAWQVVEKMRELKLSVCVGDSDDNGWHCRIATDEGSPSFWREAADVDADTAPLAICRAALKAHFAAQEPLLKVEPLKDVHALIDEIRQAGDDLFKPQSGLHSSEEWPFK